jgi:hypothetical protein
MLTRTLYASSLLSALQFAAAAPAPQVAGYTDADASFSVTQPTGSLATSFSPDSQVAVSILRLLLSRLEVLTCLGDTDFCSYYGPVGSTTESDRRPHWCYKPWTLFWYSYDNWRCHGKHHTGTDDRASTTKPYGNILQPPRCSTQPCASTIYA